MSAQKTEARRRGSRGSLIVGVVVVASTIGATAALAACGGSDRPNRASIVATRSTTAPGAGRTRHITFRETVDSITANNSTCDASGVCIFTAIGKGLHATGDFTGTDGVALMSVRATTHGTVASGLSTLVGTLAGCGRGTMTIGVSDIHDTTATKDGVGTWKVMPGGGTGDLATLSGGGTTQFFAPAAGSNGATVLQGTVSC